MIFRALLFLLSINAWAGTAFEKAACEIKLADTPELWVSLRADFKNQMKNKTREIGKLERKQSFVTAVSSFLGEGALGAVYLVQTENGPMALKLYRTDQHLKNNAVGILIQKAMGELGFAPRIQAVLTREEVQDLHKRFSFRFPEKTMIASRRGFGVLMDAIPGAWASRGQPLPAHRSQWDASEIMNRLAEIQTVLERLRIVPSDTQYLISKEGRLYLNDFDSYAWVSDEMLMYDEQMDGQRIGLLPPGTKLATGDDGQRWKFLTHKFFRHVKTRLKRMLESKHE